MIKCSTCLGLPKRTERLADETPSVTKLKNIPEYRAELPTSLPLRDGRHFDRSFEILSNPEA